MKNKPRTMCNCKLCGSTYINNVWCRCDLCWYIDESDSDSDPFEYSENRWETAYYCKCDNCFQEDIIDPIQNDKFSEIRDMHDKIMEIYFYCKDDKDDKKEEDKRHKRVLEALIEKSFEEENYELNLINNGVVENNRPLMNNISGLIDHFGERTHIYHDMKYIRHALDYIYNNLYSWDYLGATIEMNQHFADKLINGYTRIKVEEAKLLLLRSLEIATLTGDTVVISKINRRLNKEHLEELDQVFWAPGGIRCRETEIHFNQLKQLTI